MKQCPQCGTENDEQNVSCTNCGSHLPERQPDGPIGSLQYGPMTVGPGTSTPSQPKNNAPDKRPPPRPQRAPTPAPPSSSQSAPTPRPPAAYHPVENVPRPQPAVHQSVNASWPPAAAQSSSTPPPPPAALSQPVNSKSGFWQEYQRTVPQRQSQAALISLILGIVGLCCCVFPYILGPLAIFFAVRARKEANANQSMATAGLVLGILATVDGIIFLTFWARIFSAMPHPALH